MRAADTNPLGPPLALALLLSACGGSSPSVAAGPPDGSGADGGAAGLTCPIAAPVDAPRFTRDILPALQASCGSAAMSCHGGGAAPAGHVVYGTFAGRTATDVRADLVNAPAANAPAGAGWLRVKPFDPSRSWLLEKVTRDQPGGSGYGARMPLDAPDLCPSTLNALTAWIAQGALE